MAHEYEGTRDMEQMEEGGFVRIHGGVREFLPRPGETNAEALKKQHPACAVCSKALNPFFDQVGAAGWFLLSDLRPSSRHRWFGSR